MKKILNFINDKGFLVLMICLISTLSSSAQYVYDYKKSADIYYSKADYYSAAVYYEKYLAVKSTGATGLANPYAITDKPSKNQSKNLKIKTDQSEILHRLADCYRLINDFTKAEKWYAEAINFPSDKYPNVVYWYGVSLRANAKYVEAKKEFEKYVAGDLSKKAYADQAKIEIANNQFIIQQLNREEVALYTIKKSEGLNSSGANYAASYHSNYLTFTSTRADSSGVTKANPFLNALYQKNETSLGFVTVKKMAIPTSKEMEQGVACFNSNGDRVYLTRWVKKAGVNLAAIYFSENKAGVWSNPVKLSEQINVEGFSAQQPFVTSDDKFLIFSSNRTGGFGKFDLWYSLLDEHGIPSSAVNFGNIINGVDDEQAPFYHAPSESLVFSSNGKVGMGGFDLFESKGKLNGSWQEPTNMGYPVNSSKDDLYFTNKESNSLLSDALISTDRASECCLELFAINKTEKVDAAPAIIAEVKPTVIQLVEKPKVEQKAYFELNQFVLNEDTKAVLNQLAEVLKSVNSLGLEIMGYTNKIGSDAYNLELSTKRANSCKDYLISLGIDTTRLKAIGKGKCCVTGDEQKDMRAEFRMLLLN